jgi:hypothetical protein
MPTADQEDAVLETREIRNCQGAVRTYYRYAGVPGGRWYRSLVSAQIARQRGGQAMR